MRPPWNHNINYHRLVLAAAPSPCRRALDAGCGLGVLVGELAKVSEQVIGIDSDARAISLAEAAHGHESGVTFTEGDVMAYPFAPESFEFITAVAALHHLPLAPAFARFRRLLAPGGVLAVVGLYRPETAADFAWAAAAYPAANALRLIRGRTEVGAPTREATETLGDLRRACTTELPGALVRRLLLFRYLLIWTNSPATRPPGRPVGKNGQGLVQPSPRIPDEALSRQYPEVA